MKQLTDADLALQAQRGEAEAIATLYDRHQLRIYRYVRARIFDTETAHDVTGEIFLRMITYIHSYRPMNVPFTAWLYRIAHNYLVNHVQKENVAQQNVLHEQHLYHNHTLADPVLVVEKKVETESILRALNQLEETQRDVLTLRFIAGLSLIEVADVLDKSVAAVKSIQHRGLKSMRALLM